MDISNDIKELLPHTEPIILIKSIAKFIGDSIECITLFSDRNYFNDKNGIPVYWGIEIIAQAAAIHIIKNKSFATAISGRLIKARKIDFKSNYIPYDTRLRIYAKQVISSESGLFIYEGYIKTEKGEEYLIAELGILVR